MRTGVIVLVAIMAMLLTHQGASVSPREKNTEARECLKRYVPKKMLRDLHKMTSDLIKSLPSDDMRHLKLLCKFGKSVKKSKGIRILKEVLDFYQEVFRKVSLNDESQKNIQILLARLDKDVHHCLGLDQSRLPPGDRKCIKKMNDTFIKLKSQGVYKAVGEFHTVLGWIDSYIHQKTSRRREKTTPALLNQH